VPLKNSEIIANAPLLASVPDGLFQIGQELARFGR
jgi:hypothetical protein